MTTITSYAKTPEPLNPAADQLYHAVCSVDGRWRNFGLIGADGSEEAPPGFVGAGVRRGRRHADPRRGGHRRRALPRVSRRRWEVAAVRRPARRVDRRRAERVLRRRLRRRARGAASGRARLRWASVPHRPPARRKLAGPLRADRRRAPARAGEVRRRLLRGCRRDAPCGGARPERPSPSHGP